MLITVNGQPYRVPEGDPNSLGVAVDANPRTLEPVAVRGQRCSVCRPRKTRSAWSPTCGAAQTHPVGWSVGDGQFAVDRSRCRYGGTDIAGVTDNGTALRRAATTTGGRGWTKVELGVSGLIRPQFSRFGEIWAVGEVGGEQKMWLFTSDEAIEVDAPVLDEGRIVAFSISPDGSRMAWCARYPAGPRSAWPDRPHEQRQRRRLASHASITCRPDENPQSDASRRHRLDRRDRADRAGPAVGERPAGSYRISQDAFTDQSTRASRATGTPSTSRCSMRTKTAIVGRPQDGQTWRNTGTQWVLFLDNIERSRTRADVPLRPARGSARGMFALTVVPPVQRNRRK